MKAFQQIGWLCGRPVLRVVRQGEALPRGVAEFAYREEMLKPSWWSAGTELTISQQFQAYLAFLTEQPGPVQADLRMLLAGTPIEPKASAWGDLMLETSEEFTRACNDWCEDYDGLVREWSELLEAGNPPLQRLNAIAYQATSLWRSTVIEELGTRRFLPRYGFPIGLQGLTSPFQFKPEKQPIKLEREGILAVNEYVPGSSMLVGGRLYRSHGVLRSWSRSESDTGSENAHGCTRVVPVTSRIRGRPPNRPGAQLTAVRVVLGAQRTYSYLGMAIRQRDGIRRLGRVLSNVLAIRRWLQWPSLRRRRPPQLRISVESGDVLPRSQKEENSWPSTGGSTNAVLRSVRAAAMRTVKRRLEMDGSIFQKALKLILRFGSTAQEPVGRPARHQLCAI